MAPAAGRTFPSVRALICWEYAKLISGHALGDRSAFGFVNATYQRLLQRRVQPSTVLTENKQLALAPRGCAYCDSAGPLQWEHIVPRALGGPDCFDNLVLACPACNRAKGARDPYQWFALQDRIDGVPRLVLGKLLKLVFNEYERLGLLDDAAYMAQHRIERISLSRIFRKPSDAPCASPS